VEENYFPDGFKAQQFYKPGVFGKEKLFKERLEILWEKRGK
jgi:replication-associated recombination protein RarA